MPWIFIEYPWQVMFPKKEGGLPGDGIRPDNGAGLLFCGEPAETDAQLASGLVFTRMSDGAVWCELPGPSFRPDAAKDLTVQLPGHTERTVLRYRDASTLDHAKWTGQCHGLLTDSLQELAALLYENRAKAYNRFQEMPLAEIIEHYYCNRDDDFASRSLICEFAEDLPGPIQEIVERPRRLLQRNHTQVQLDRLQEMDATSLIDYARRPGHTPAIKAGDSQRLMAVVREESADTLENRVVHDFCIRARLASIGYVAEECSRCPRRQQCNGDDRRDSNADTCSRRVRRVTSFARRCEQFLLSSTLRSVSPLTVPCRMPNYALQQNVRYVKVWDAYQKLLRQEDIRDQTWRWKRRTWTDYVRACMMEVMRMLSFNGQPPAFRASRKPIRIWKEPQYGCWLKPEPFDGPLVFENRGTYTSLYLFNREDVGRLPISCNTPLDQLNADLYWVAASTNWTEVRVMPVWTLVGDARWEHPEIAERLRSECLNGIAQAADIWQDRMRKGMQIDSVTIPKLLLIRAAESPNSWQKDLANLLEVPPDKANISFFRRHLENMLQEIMT